MERPPNNDNNEARGIPPPAPGAALADCLDGMKSQFKEALSHLLRSQVEILRANFVEAVRSMANEFERVDTSELIGEGAALEEGTALAPPAAARPEDGLSTAHPTDPETGIEPAPPDELPECVLPFPDVHPSTPTDSETVDLAAPPEEEMPCTSATAHKLEDIKAVRSGETSLAFQGKQTRLALTDNGQTLHLKKQRQTALAIVAPAPAGSHEISSPLAGHLFAEAQEHHRNNQSAAALLRYGEVINLDPMYVPAYRDRGQLLRSLGRHEEALVDFNRACELDAVDGFSLLRRGNVLVDLGRLDEAIDDYGHAIECDPQQAIYYLNRGLAHAKRNDFGEVIADADQALALNPELTDAYFIRGFALHRRSRYDEAIADFDRLLELDPKNVLAWNERGLVHTAKGHYGQAIRDYIQALKLNPKLLLARYNRGIAYRLKGDYEMAITDFSEILRRKPKNHQAHLNRGICYFALGDYDRALPDFARAHELLPDDQDTASRLEVVRKALREQHQSRPNKSQEAATAGDRHSIAVECPRCGSAGKVQWDRLDRLFQCKGCSSVYRFNQGGMLVKVSKPKQSVSAAVEDEPKKSLDWMTGEVEQPRKARRRAQPRGNWGGSISYRPLVIAAMIVAISYPLYSIARSPRYVEEPWQRYDTQELTQAAQTVPDGTRIELRGPFLAVLNQDKSPTIVLGAAIGSGQVACQLDPYALSTKRYLPRAHLGKLIIVRGKFHCAPNGTITLTDGHIAAVLDNDAVP